MLDWLIVVLLRLSSESSFTVGNNWLTLHDVEEDIWISGDVTEGGLLLVFSVIPEKGKNVLIERISTILAHSI